MDARLASPSGTADLCDDPSYLDVLAEALIDHALRDEIEGFGESERRDAASFVALTAQRRTGGVASIRLESLGGDVGQRRMRLCVVNDDMPFLVDSVTAAIAARGLTIHRLLHPVVQVTRSSDGGLMSSVIAAAASSNEAQREAKHEAPHPIAESIMYIELDRLRASERRDLVDELHRVLADVRVAVRDWGAMQAKLHQDAAHLADDERAALLHWFADGAMTLLGYEAQQSGRPPFDALGVLTVAAEPLWPGDPLPTFLEYFEQGGTEPMIGKAERVSTVHRRVPFDLVIMPFRDGGKVVGIRIYACLWTSKALRTSVEDVPVLRRRFALVRQQLGFAPESHAGKAFADVVASIPHDVSLLVQPEAIKDLCVTAMSLVDRPRPALALLRSVLKGRVSAFVWLPRDELDTHRRDAIGEMLAEASGGRVLSWMIELGEGQLALIRYLLAIDMSAPTPEAGALDRRLQEMVRGWLPSVESALVQRVGAARAMRLALRHIDGFPSSYRYRTDAAEAAEDVLRIAGLEGDDRDVRLHRKADDLVAGGNRLHLKIYRLGEVIALSDAVPVLENFGFRVVDEQPTELAGPTPARIHDFSLELPGDDDAAVVIERAGRIETAIAAVLEARAENDVFNQLLVGAGLESRDVVLFRAWFRYLRQAGLSYSLNTVAEALRRAPQVARAIVALFDALHDPTRHGARDQEIAAAESAIDEGLARVAAVDEDRILRMIRAVVGATLRTNAFAQSGSEALAFKLESARIPNLPAPVPWREIWVYSPRVEGIHLRAGPIARGGLRWSDRRDDFRTEVLGLMKAQIVKNAVIVPTGAKGGFYPKRLPSASDREAWLAEGTEAYRTLIRALLSVTDNLVQGKVVHPQSVAIRDGDDPYLVVAADKGTASFSDIANAISLERGFWLGDAFASGGSQGYDHKAMAITARGAWISVQRHFLELGIDVQTQPIAMVGCGDMSGDVFGNGLLRSKAVKLVAAFDHRHVFLDPAPDPEASWNERERLYRLPRSSWNDYDRALISPGGGVFPRAQKSIALTPQARAVLGLQVETIDPSSLISAILRAPVDLVFFGGIGTYVKARHENHVEVGDPGNDAVRVNADEMRAKVIGEGANLAITQAARIEFALGHGRINTDFIDNSAGVDCSDHEVNLKIPLNREVIEHRLSQEDRNRLLAEMQEEVAAVVLEDNRLQTLALSIAERGGAGALPSLVRTIEMLEESGHLNREVEGIASNQDLRRRAQEDRGLVRPELAVLLSVSKIALQAAIEESKLTEDPTLTHDLLEAFPKPMRDRHSDAVLAHRLRREIIATRVANRFVNRLGITAAFSLAEEEGASFAQTAAAFLAAERLFQMDELWRDLDLLDAPEPLRLELFDQASKGLQLQIADVLRGIPAGTKLSEVVDTLAPGLAKLRGAVDKLVREESSRETMALKERLTELGAPADIVERIVGLFEQNGSVGIAALARRLGVDEITLTEAYSMLGEALGLDWAQAAANRFLARDQWERLLTAGLARDFEQLRLDFLERHGSIGPKSAVEHWLAAQAARIAQFRRTVARAKTTSVTTAPMLAQIATQARVLLGR